MQLERPQPLNGGLLGRKSTLIDALVDLIVRCRLLRQIPVWLNLDTLAHLRITVLSQRWPAY